MRTATLTLLRHGLCEGEAEGRYVGHTNAPLTTEGRAQLVAMRQEFAYPAAEALFVSPLGRCAETAALLYPGQTTIALAGLKEYFFGEYENKTPEELDRHPIFHRWIAGEPGLTPPFGEALPDFQRRLAETFTKLCDGLLKTGTRSAAVITHGGVVMTLLAMFGLPELPLHEWLCPAATGYTLRLEPSVWLRGRKAEVAGLAPLEAAEEGDPEAGFEERLLWKELEDAQWT
ncbi:MAG: histidine phosphatase family protein [Oscillospiraceae bacterium]|jgi:alpha-ribazole phosphatase|nr:histidine phosphatase family protein [Oscillospiraceae bacterium]